MPQTGIQNVDGTRARVKHKTYTLGSFSTVNFSTDTKDFVAAENYQTAYEIDVEDGIGEWFGRGMNENPLQAQGFAGLRFVNDTAAAQATGDFRIAVRNAQNELLYTITQGDLLTYDQYDGAAGSGTEKDRDNRAVFPNQQANFETEPHIITIDLDVDSDITIDDAESETSAKLEGYQAVAVE